MRTKFILIFCLVSLALLATFSAIHAQGARIQGEVTGQDVAVGPVSPLAPVSPGFTYQGQLKSNGNPINGNCDFQFSLYDSLNGSGQIGATQTSPNVPVNKGIFTVMLNQANEFGSTPFNGEERYLAISVRCPTGVGGYASLSPRQPLSAAPYAFSLKPEAVISGIVTGTMSSPDGGIVKVYNNASSGYCSYAVGLRSTSGIDSTMQFCDASGIYGRGTYDGVLGTGGIFGAGGVSQADYGWGLFGRADGKHGTGLFVNTSGLSSFGAYVINSSDVYTAGFGIYGVKGYTSGYDLLGHYWYPGAVVGDTNVGNGVIGVASGSGDIGVMGIITGTADRALAGYAVAPTGYTYGVYGYSGSTNGTGVYGSSPRYGVYGQSSSTAGIGVYGSATATTGTTYGVYAQHESTNGASIYGHANMNGAYTTAGVYGRSDGDNGFGVAGHNYYSGVGVGAWSYAGNLIEAFSGDYPGGTLQFYVTGTGYVYANGGYGTFKTSSLDGETHATSSIQSTEAWLEDFGHGDLVDGIAIITIAPDFTGMTNLSVDYMVFVTLEGDCRGVYITNKTPTTFEVHELNGGKSNIPFSYRIVAKPTGSDSARLPVVTIPATVNVERQLDETTQTQTQPQTQQNTGPAGTCQIPQQPNVPGSSTYLP